MKTCHAVKPHVHVLHTEWNILHLHCVFQDMLLCNFFIITNLIHKFLVHSHKLHKIKFPYMFRAQSAHHQEVNDTNSLAVAQDGHLQRVTIPEAAYVQFASLTS